MTYPLARLLAAAGLTLILAAGCSGRPPAYGRPSLRPDITVGLISGAGGEALAQALRRGAKNRDGERVLSGEVTMANETEKDVETVPVVVEKGRAKEVYRADPFTNRLWRVKERTTETEFESHDLERVYSRMIFDWRLTPGDGNGPDSGRITLELGRVYGGFLAANKQAPPLKNQNEALTAAMEKELAGVMAHLVVLNLGRHIDAAELEAASDPQSGQARRLAAAGRWDEAKEIWLNLLKLNPKYGPALYNLGLYWEKNLDPQTAWRFYREAFLNDGSPRHRAALTRLTELMDLSGLPRRESSDGRP
ncbi:MAG: hypothetical protein LBS31_04945 [Candidatus Adiutrix sp.]|jgi:hypothetical protein|nr:hypothetical protein [Candidatus Adiutrix sp.]